jgi:hypothetical protein
VNSDPGEAPEAGGPDGDAEGESTADKDADEPAAA